MHVHYSNKMDLGYSLFAPPNERDIVYLRDRLIEKSADFGASLRQRVSSVFEQFNSSGAMYRARHVYRQAKNLFVEDRIYGYGSLEQLQSAQSVMQRYILAQPDLRQLLQQQLIDGYSDSYKERDAGVIGWGHKEYDQVMHGVMESDGDELKFGYSFDLELEPEHQLDVLSQQDVLYTWSTIRKILKDTDDDPTNIFGGKI